MSTRIGLYNATLNVSVPRELRDRVKALAASRGVSMSEIVRELLELLVDDEEGPGPGPG